MQAAHLHPAPARALASLPIGAGGLDSFQRVDAVPVDAVELIKAIQGYGEVALRGFSQPHQLPVWTHPAVAHVRVADSPQEALAALSEERRGRTGLLVLAAGLLIVLAFSAGALVAGRKVTDALSAQPTLSWTAVEVSQAGLHIATPAGRVVIPPGGRLPNGDVLVSVQSTRKLAILSSGTLLVNGSPERRSPP